MEGRQGVCETEEQEGWKGPAPPPPPQRRWACRDSWQKLKKRAGYDQDLLASSFVHSLHGLFCERFVGLCCVVVLFHE